jgi:hypothetical protein
MCACVFASEQTSVFLLLKRLISITILALAVARISVAEFSQFLTTSSECTPAVLFMHAFVISSFEYQFFTYS